MVSRVATQRDGASHGDEISGTVSFSGSWLSPANVYFCARGIIVVLIYENSPLTLEEIKSPTVKGKSIVACLFFNLPK